MKLKDIAAILRAGRIIYIIEGKDGQWLGDGCCAYPIYGLPHMEQDNMRTLLDIPEKQWDRYNVINKRFLFDESDNALDEFQLADIGVSLSHLGTVAIPLVGNRKLFYILPKYIKPFQDGKSYSYFARKTSDGNYNIVVKEGFLLRGVIVPYDIVNEKFIDTLELVCSLSRDILSKKRDDKLRSMEIKNFMNMEFAEGEE